jgi:integrase
MSRVSKQKEYWDKVKRGEIKRVVHKKRKKKKAEDYIKLIKDIDYNDGVLVEKYVQDKRISLQFFKSRSSYNAVCNLYYLRKKLDKSFNDATKEDWKKVKEQMLGNYKWQYINTMFGALKSFYKWYWAEHPDNKDESDYHPSIRFFHYEKPKGAKTEWGRLIEWDDVKNVVYSLQENGNYKISALISYLYDSGARVSEVFNLKWKDFEETFNQDGGEFLINNPDEYIHCYEVTIRAGEGAKTGERINRCYMSYLSLYKYRQSLPFKEREPEMYVFKYKNLQELRKDLKEVKDKMGINYNFYPHHFRRSSATLRARMGWNKARIDNWFGWSESANTSSKYIFISGRYQKIKSDLKF